MTYTFEFELHNVCISLWVKTSCAWILCLFCETFLDSFFYRSSVENMRWTQTHTHICIRTHIRFIHNNNTIIIRRKMQTIAACSGSVSFLLLITIGHISFVVIISSFFPYIIALFKLIVLFMLTRNSFLNICHFARIYGVINIFECDKCLTNFCLHLNYYYSYSMYTTVEVVVSFFSLKIKEEPIYDVLEAYTVYIQILIFLPIRTLEIFR